MRVLITGGAGFVGSHLSEALLERGDEVFIIDNLSTGSMENVVHLKTHARFHYTIDTVANEPVLAELIDRCDIVVHLAAAVGVKLIVEQPVHTIETNVHGTEVVLKHANKKKKLVLIASTSEVYGKSTDVPFRETADLVLGPTTKHRWAYACSKMIDEFLALAYWKERKLPVIVVRLFNTVGPQADRPVRDGDSELRASGAFRPADHGLRRRDAVAQLYVCRGRGEGYGSLDQRAPSGRSGLQYRQRPRDHDPGPRREGEVDDRQRLRHRHDPVRSGVRGRLRGHAAPRARTSRRIRALIGYEPTVELDEILARVIAHFRQAQASHS